MASRKNSMAISAFFAHLGTPMKNIRSSWCAYSAERHRAVFTVWTHLLVDGRYLMRAAGPTSEDHLQGSVEMRRILDLAIAGGDEVLGILCRVKDASAEPWVRKDFVENRVLVMRLVLEPEGIIAHVTGQASTESALLGRIGPGAIVPYSTTDD